MNWWDSFYGDGDELADLVWNMMQQSEAFYTN